MPAYEVLHSIPLNDSQRDNLAQAITKIHSENFTNIADACVYVAGKRSSPRNHVRGWTRSGPGRTQDDWNNITQALHKAWHSVVGHAQEAHLRTVSIFAGVDAALEAGFQVPLAGQDVPWLYQNWEAFQARAEQGEEEFTEMVKEVQERGLVKFE